MNTLRLLVVDDHPIFRRGLRNAFEGSDIELIAEASSGEEAIAIATDLQPDIVLMDVAMSGMGGIEATRRILDVAPHIRVLMVTMQENNDSLFAAMRAGARGYVLKGADSEELVRAIRAVANGELALSPAIAQRVMDFFTHPPSEAPAQAFPTLTTREREVLELIAQGLSNAEIARRFSLSDKTVRNHVSNIYSKLQVLDRAQAIVQARKAGMGGSMAGQ